VEATESKRPNRSVVQQVLSRGHCSIFPEQDGSSVKLTTYFNLVSKLFPHSPHLSWSRNSVQEQIYLYPNNYEPPPCINFPSFSLLPLSCTRVFLGTFRSKSGHTLRSRNRTLVHTKHQVKAYKTKQTPCPLIRKRTIPTERPLLVDEI
jgi:hypothetical protein